MSKSEPRYSKRRQRAREAGMCIVCFGRKPVPGRSVCSNCNERAAERMAKRRATLRERTEWQHIIAAHEAAGDKAQAQHLFDDATRRYQEALNVAAIAPDDRQRLVEKLGSVSLLSENPTVATPWRDSMLDAYLGDSETAEKAIEMLLQTARQRWIDSKTPDGVPICARAIRIAEVHGLDRQRKVATLRLVSHLIALGRFNEATQQLATLGNIDGTDDLAVRIEYHYKMGSVAAMCGMADEAYEHHEHAVALAKEDTDLYRIMAVLGDYAIKEIALGNLERGKALHEQALLVVRRNHMGWLVPHECMAYASILARMGQYSSARGYLLEALSSDAHAPIVEERFAAIGIPIALHLGDDAILVKCTRPAAIDLAFQSHEPARVGPVAVAFARLYLSQGQQSKARALLHKALGIVRYVDDSIDLPLVIAKHGSPADILSARKLLETRVGLPSAHVAEACLALFDAFVEQRAQKHERAQELATQAAERFDRLHWYAYGDVARSLVPLAPPVASVSERLHEKPISGLPTITEREQQVAELVLRGLTNREIADMLAIQERTVEAHMTAILKRLGIRSRHQLAERFTRTKNS